MLRLKISIYRAYKMFKFLDLFKKKQASPIPTIKPNTKHKIDDKRQHGFFLIELENLLTSSNFFKNQYIINYLDLYKTYKAFTGKDHSLLSKQTYFIESLTDEAQQYKKQELKNYAKNIVGIANRRAFAKTNLMRLEEDKLVKEVILIFPNNDLICKNVIAQKKQYHNKRMSISKAPIFPLQSCIKCSSCSFGITYKPHITL